MRFQSVKCNIMQLTKRHNNIDASHHTTLHHTTPHHITLHHTTQHHTTPHHTTLHHTTPHNTTSHHFTPHQTTPHHTTLHHTLEGTVLENIESIKYLGVTITSDLKWNSQIRHVCSRANGTLGFLRRNLFSCPQDVKVAAAMLSELVAQPLCQQKANKYV